VARKKGKHPLTLLIVPHSQRPPISLRIPPWALSVALVMVVALLMGAAFFATRHALLTRQLEELRREQQVEQAREGEMRKTILSQQQEVKSLQEEAANLDQQMDKLETETTKQVDRLQAETREQVDRFQAEVSGQVEEFQTDVTEQVDHFQTDLTERIKKVEADLAAIDRLSDQIRAIIGLEATPTPTPPSSSQRMGGQGPSQEAALLGSGIGPLTYNLPTQDAVIHLGDDESLRRLQFLEALLPIKQKELEFLREQVLQRVESVEPEKRRDPEELEEALRLFDAAPKLWPAEGNITSGFGYREFKGRREFHTGADIGVWYGTEVKATKDGLVVDTGWQTGYGWTVEIRHEMGYSTFYAHLSRHFVEAGDGVRAGDVIGLSGASGNTTGPHLHYEIRINGTPIDPLKYLSVGEESRT
jgi:murein DD-endopeptidase MepM/ murein hydrolase activator NlpD